MDEHEISNAPKQRRMDPYHTIIAVLVCSFTLTLFSQERDYVYGFFNVLLGHILVFSSMMKIAHILYFAQHFAPHSFITRAWPPYAYILPFIQLLFGALLTNGTFIFLTSVLMFFIMGELFLAAFMTLMYDGVHVEQSADDHEPFLWPHVILCESLLAIIIAMLNMISAVRTW